MTTSEGGAKGGAERDEGLGADKGVSQDVLVLLRAMRAMKAMDAEDSDSAKSKSNAPAWIAVVGAVASAVLAAVATLASSQAERDVSTHQASAAQFQAEIQAETSRLQAEIQSESSRLQAEIQERLAAKQRRVEKAELYGSMVKGLSDPETSGFAVLAMWLASEDDQERRLVLATALTGGESTRRAVESLMTASPKEFDNDLREIFAAAQKRNDKQLESQAQNALYGNVSNENALAVLLKSLDREGAVTACASQVDEVVQLLQKNPGFVQQLMETKASTANGAVLYDYIAYVLGQRQRLLDRYAKTSVTDAALVDATNCAKLRADDWPIAIDYGIAYLSTAEGFNRSRGFQVFDAIYLDSDKVPKELRQRVMALCRTEVMTANAYEYARLYALRSLVEWSEPVAIEAISAVLAGGLADSKWLSRIEEVLDQTDVVRGRLREKWRTLDLPEVRGGAEAWTRWRESHSQFVTNPEAHP